MLTDSLIRLLLISLVLQSHMFPWQSLINHNKHANDSDVHSPLTLFSLLFHFYLTCQCYVTIRSPTTNHVYKYLSHRSCLSLTQTMCSPDEKGVNFLRPRSFGTWCYVGKCVAVISSCPVFI